MEKVLGPHEKFQKSSPQTSELNTFLIPGAIFGSRRPSGIQIAEPSHPQLDDFALLTVQSGVGLDNFNLGDVHGHLHALRGGLPPQRAGLQLQEIEEVRRRSLGDHRSHR